eukprot:4926675-Pleurochrysis_carterae.AAC.1
MGTERQTLGREQGEGEDFRSSKDRGTHGVAGRKERERSSKGYNRMRGREEEQREGDGRSERDGDGRSAKKERKREREREREREQEHLRSHIWKSCNRRAFEDARTPSGRRTWAGTFLRGGRLAGDPEKHAAVGGKRPRLRGTRLQQRTGCEDAGFSLEARHHRRVMGRCLCALHCESAPRQVTSSCPLLAVSLICSHGTQRQGESQLKSTESWTTAASSADALKVRECAIRSLVGEQDMLKKRIIYRRVCAYRELATHGHDPI